MGRPYVLGRGGRSPHRRWHLERLRSHRHTPEVRRYPAVTDQKRNQIWVAATIADELDDLGVRVAARADSGLQGSTTLLLRSARLSVFEVVDAVLELPEPAYLCMERRRAFGDCCPNPLSMLSVEGHLQAALNPHEGI